MNLYYFFSSRLNSLQKDSFSYLVTRIAIASIALGLAVMIISFSILEGFQKNIKDKIFSFAGHIQITKYDSSNSYEELPISTNSSLYRNQKMISGVDRIQVFSLQPSLLKSAEGVHGIILKGIGPDFYKERFTSILTQGRFIDFKDTMYSKDMLISRKIANTTLLGIGDTALIYFVQNPPRYRKLKVAGIYESGLEEFDELMVLCDIRLNKRINNWNDTLVGGYEVFLTDFSKLEEGARAVYKEMDYDMQLEKVDDRYIQIFEWLKLLDRNVVIFLILILFVASFNMVSTLAIMIMERTNMIGLLKALGASNSQIRKIFIYNGLFILLKGVLFGNLLGIGFCGLQDLFHLIPLDPLNYYMSTVPIEWNWFVIGGINLLTFLLIFLVLIIPVMVISNIKPVKAIKFD